LLIFDILCSFDTKDAKVTVEKHVGIAKEMFSMILEENVENNMYGQVVELQKML